MYIVSGMQKIQVLLFGTFQNFFSEYFQIMIGCIHGCRTRGYRGLTVVLNALRKNGSRAHLLYQNLSIGSSD